MCDSQDLTLHTMLADGRYRQTDPRQGSERNRLWLLKKWHFQKTSQNGRIENVYLIREDRL